MNPIPKKLRAQIAADPFMKKCCLCGKHPNWHHSTIYAGAQLQEAWAIVPACPECHRTKLPQLKLVALLRTTDQQLLSISKVHDFIRERENLKKKFPEIVNKIIGISGVTTTE